MKRIAAFLSLGMLLAGCASSGADVIKIGYIGPLTGDAVSYGTDTLNGARMAVDKINAGGGIGGKMVELIAEDSRCSGADAANAVRKLVNVDKVVAIVGGQCSSETLAAAPIVEQAKVVLVSPISSNPDITNAGQFIFRVYPSDGLKGKALGEYFKGAGFTKLAIISENTDFCQGLASAVKADVPEGMEVVFDETVDPGTKDYRTLFTRLKDTEFDVFFANGQSDATVGEMAKQMRELGMTQQIVGSDTADSVNLGKSAPEAVEGLKPLSVPSLTATTGAAGQFASEYRAAYGEAKASLFFGALSFDAVGILAEALGKAKPGDELKDALLTMPPRVGIAGTISFDANGDVKGIPFAMKEFKNGELVQSQLIELK